MYIFKLAVPTCKIYFAVVDVVQKSMCLCVIRMRVMTAPPPPTPSHLLRTHSASLTALSFSDDNERLYSGDASGLVVVTSTTSLRAIASWKAHTDGLLGVEEWGNCIITYVLCGFVGSWNSPPSN